MGVVAYSVSDDSKGLPATHEIASGAINSSWTASTIQHEGEDLVLRPGQVFQVHSTADIRINFDSNEAAPDKGHFVPAEHQRRYRALEAGPVSVIDVLGV